MKMTTVALPAIGAAALIALGLALNDPANGQAVPATTQKTPEPPAGAINALSPSQRTAVEAVVRRYILDHPEIIPEAIARLQQREVTRLIDSRRSDIETPFASAWAGAKDGDVTLVEFYDYACPYCQQAKADVEKLLASDKRLRVVYREYPVIAEASREAAIASLSAASQGRHAQFYDRMYGVPGRVNHEKVVAVVRAAGLNEMRTARDLASQANSAEITRNIELGQALGLSGTPAYVVGDRVLVGAVGYEALKQAVAEAREKRS